MFPFAITIDDGSSYTGIVRCKTARKSKKVYAAINYGQGWDYHIEENGKYTDYYGVGLVALAHHLNDTYFCEYESFRKLYEASPSSFPSFRLAVHNGTCIPTNEPFEYHSFKFDEEKITQEELNRLLAAKKMRLQIW